MPAKREVSVPSAATDARGVMPRQDAVDAWATQALAIEGSGTGVWDRNVVSGEIHYSKGWKAILGYGEFELSNRIDEAYTRVHPDDLAYVQAAMQAHFDGKSDTYEVEHRIRCKDGSYKWICSRGKVVSRDGAGRALRMVGTTTDITAMRVMAENLRQTAELVVNLTDAVPGLVFQYRQPPGGVARFSYASAGIADMFELEPGDVYASAERLEQRIHPDDLAAYHASLRAAAESGASWHLEFRVCLPRQGLRWRQGDARPQWGPGGETVWHGFITDITDRKRAELELRELAVTDALTALPNRRHFMSCLNTELARIRRGLGNCAALLMCDLDHFKQINDSWGHAVGDHVLRHFAGLLRERLRASDLVGRIGGEEFAIVLADADRDGAQAFALDVQQRIAATPFTVAGQPIALTVSIGITIMHAQDEEAGYALGRSDAALYQAKQHGRNRIEWQLLPVQMQEGSSSRGA